MRLFQNSGLYPSYLRYFDRLAVGAVRFDDRLRLFLNDRFGALHFLQPVLDGSPDAFFTNGDDKTLQKYWARETGYRRQAHWKKFSLRRSSSIALMFSTTWIRSVTAMHSCVDCRGV